MAGDKNISQLNNLGRAFNPGDLLIIRGFLENRDFKVTYAELAAAVANLVSADTLAALAGNGGTPNAANLFVTEDGLSAILAGLDLSSGARVISADLIITSDTAGTIDAQWIDNEGDTNTVSASPLTFIGAPSAGNFRFDVVAGNDDGTVAVVSGAEGAEGVAAIPSVSGTQIVLRVVLWDETGIAETSPPGQSNSGDFSTSRLLTAVAPNTTGKYAKIWEGNLSKDAHLSMELAYNEPVNAASPYAGSGLRNLKVSFTVNSSRSIITDTVQIVTDGGTAGEFVLYQISGNKAALYHKSNHYWGRIQYRVLFQNSQVRLSDFVNNAAYGAAPGAPVGTWVSELAGGGSGVSSVTATGDVIDNTDSANPIIDPLAATASGSTLNWGKDRTYGTYSLPLTGSLTDADAGAVTDRQVVLRIFHQDTSWSPPNANWRKIDGSRAYDPAKINLITVERFESTNKTYFIDWYE